jgi:protein DGCR14
VFLNILDETPSTFETPSTLPNSTPRMPGLESQRSNKSNTSATSSKSIASNHSLDSFLYKYTSEDNHSFEEIVEAADQKLRQKFAILYEAEGQQSELLENALALPSIERQFDAIEKPKNVDTWTYRNKNYIMYIPDGVDFTNEEKIEMARKKQEIQYSNTRLSNNPFNDSQNKETISELAKCQSKSIGDKVGFDGKALQSATPQIRGYDFIKSPSPCPGLIDESPMMTWGEIEGTPFRLDAGDTPISVRSVGPSFRIAETSKRENIALKLAEDVHEKHRAKKTKALEAAKRSMCASPNIRNSLERLSSMSPAAKRLATGKYSMR